MKAIKWTGNCRNCRNAGTDGTFPNFGPGVTGECSVCPRIPLRDFRRVGTVLPAPPVLTLVFYATSRMFFHYGVILKTVPYPSCPVSVRT